MTNQETISNINYHQLKTLSSLAAIKQLRQEFDQDLTNKIITILETKQRATKKFKDGFDLFFSEKMALEQASSFETARYRAKFFHQFTTVADLCCSCGIDSIALAEVVRNVVAVDMDPFRLACAKSNAEFYNIENINWQEGVVPDDIPTCEAWYCDPSRRKDGKRCIDINDYSPKVDELIKRISHLPGVIKCSPMLDNETIPKEWSLEYVSLKGEVREALLFSPHWQRPPRSATVLPMAKTITGVPQPWPEPKGVDNYIIEPDRAIIKAELVGNLCEEYKLKPMFQNIVYLATNECIQNPFFHTYKVVDYFEQANIKKIRKYLREKEAGIISVKKRGFPLNADEILKKIKHSPKKGGQEMVLFFTRDNDRHIVVVTKRIEE